MEPEMDTQWDKKMTAKLVQLGMEWETARKVVGIMTEERMNADQEGYKRGFNDGHEDGRVKALKQFKMS
ncbi:hypothetical protein C4565_00350 [Candidatus Parcubacteria bacterium]|nr:MAG: hypothetical protein C4565_00350 [Candidatus Parcubacteria bacterium]